MVVVDPASVSYQVARPQDAQGIAELHAESWRRHYRGAFSDAFLDGDVVGYLLSLWTTRLAEPAPLARTILAFCDGRVTGLAHTFLDDDPRFGAFLDNLHVAYGMKRLGVGTRLLDLTRQAVRDWSPASGLYLWVLQQNADAQAFYSARGGVCVESGHTPPPGEDPSRLCGTPLSLRYAWRAPLVP